MIVCIHPVWHLVWIGTKGEDRVVECPITHVVNFAREPFHANKLIVAVIEPQVDAGNTAVAMLDALLFVNVDVEEAEKDSFREALVEGELHASLLLERSKTLVCLRGRVIPKNIGMHESVRNH